MLSRTATVLVSASRNPFAHFYKQVGPRLTRTQATKRMAVAGSLWTATKPQFNTKDSSARVKAAMSLYRSRGNRAVAGAHTALTTRRGGAAAHRRAAHRASGNKRKSASHRRKGAVSKGRRAASSSPALVFRKFRLAVTRRKLSATEAAFLRAAFRATASFAPAARVAAGKRVLADIRRRPAAGKRATKGRRLRRAPRKYRARRAARSHRRRASPKTRRSVVAKKVAKAPLARAVNPYQRFRQQVLKRARLPATEANKARVQRLWFLTSSQRRLGVKGRVDMAVGLLQKKRPRTAKKWAATAVKKRRVGRPLSAARNAKRPRRAAVTPTRKRNPYLRFYREMVLTGAIPNHPHRARASAVQRLWDRTKHLKTVKARIKLGRSYATGVIPLPKDPQKLRAATVAKPKARVGKAKVKKVAKVAKVAKVVKHPAPKPARAPIRFTVPAIYEKSPFAGAFIALHKYAAGATPSAKMHNVSSAWAKSAAPASVDDRRTPRQRIRAVAEVLARA